ncbi:MAG: four helix bundle protein [Candidatus Marinimicrobia bacterium]|nr:four helix bundle protein [Candidatus Neomarinimicrobiota bacterium]
MNELAQRLFDFSVRSLKLTSNLPNTPEFKVIRHQLAKSATSSGVNYEESQAGSSKADFTNKIRISLREMRESNYWLRIIKSITKKTKQLKRIRLIDRRINTIKKNLRKYIEQND